MYVFNILMWFLDIGSRGALDRQYRGMSVYNSNFTYTYTLHPIIVRIKLEKVNKSWYFNITIKISVREFYEDISY